MSELHVLKFGGSSLKSEALFNRVADIALEKLRNGRVALVLSAPGKTTDKLIQLIDLAKKGKDFEQELNNFQKSCIEDIVPNRGSFDTQMTRIFDFLQKRLDGIKHLEACPDRVYIDILSLGEKISIHYMKALLEDKGKSPTLLDPITFFKTDEGDPLNALIRINESKDSVQNALNTKSDIFVMPGFVAGDENGEAVLLGRNGSDYSATALAACAGATSCEIWTDVDGVMTCDPRIVENPRVLENLSYEEAMELSRFNAKILHAKTIAPIARFHIPCSIKNTYNPDADGTLISTQSSAFESPVAGISLMDNIAMFNVSGPGMKGLVGMAASLFATLSSADISILLISQSSSEFSICFCIDATQAEDAKRALDAEFELELKAGHLDPITYRQDVNIITIVGDGMIDRVGVSKQFFATIAHAGANIFAIAQGSSERSLSAVISKNDGAACLRTCYASLFAPTRHLNVVIYGCGTIGKTLIEQIARQQDELLSKGIDLHVRGIANSRKMAWDPKSESGIKLDSWEDTLNDADTTSSIGNMLSLYAAEQFTTPIFVDMTSSDDLPKYYEALLEAGFHIVAANKKAASGEYEVYNSIKSKTQKTGRSFHYETNVGAGLPVIETFQNLLHSGDELLKFEGILSGSLSYICGRLDDGVSIQDALKEAQEKGMTEPDPNEDLSGEDFARKILIISRESGLKLDMDDIDVIPMPDHIDPPKEGHVYRYIGAIEDGKASAMLTEIPLDHPLSTVKEGENAIALTTKYYSPKPMVIRGYGAGPDVTAAGVFGDILKVREVV